MKNIFKKLFHRHKWIYTSDANGDMSRKCSQCGKIQTRYKDIWYNTKNKYSK